MWFRFWRSVSADLFQRFQQIRQLFWIIKDTYINACRRERSKRELFNLLSSCSPTCVDRRYACSKLIKIRELSLSFWDFLVMKSLYTTQSTAACPTWQTPQSCRQIALCFQSMQHDEPYAAPYASSFSEQLLSHKQLPINLATLVTSFSWGAHALVIQGVYNWSSL